MKIKKILDLSQEVYSGSPGYPGNPLPDISMICTLEKGDIANTEMITMPSHSGTHMDAPWHFIKEGRRITDFTPSDLTGNAVVLDLTPLNNDEEITVPHLEKHMDMLKKAEIPILYTGWCRLRKQDDRWVHHSPWLGKEAAQWLVDRKIKGVGIDHFSIGTMDEKKDTPTHTCLLSNNIWILEDLHIPEDMLKDPYWFLVAAPLKLKNSSGAPTRVYAIQFE